MAQLRREQRAIEAMDLEILVVTFEELWVAKLYTEEVKLSWPLLLDADRNLYRQYRMERASLGTVMSPASWWGYIKLLLRGRRLKSPTGDIRQLGGDVLIDPGGIIRFHHVTQAPLDRPDLKVIFKIVEDATAAT